MLSKEEVPDIISYCDIHGITRRERLIELGRTHWEFYKSRRRHLEIEKSHPHKTSGSFIQLKSNGEYVPSSVTAMERSVNPGLELHRASNTLTIECQTTRGGMVRVNGKISTVSYRQTEVRYGGIL